MWPINTRGDFFPDFRLHLCLTYFWDTQMFQAKTLIFKIGYYVRCVSNNWCPFCRHTTVPPAHILLQAGRRNARSLATHATLKVFNVVKHVTTCFFNVARDLIGVWRREGFIFKTISLKMTRPIKIVHGFLLNRLFYVELNYLDLLAVTTCH